MGVHLEYGIGPDGRPVFASSMVGVDPRDRPRVTCPECDDAVTFKAGDRAIITPHVSHRGGAHCAATAPETAAHFNAKMAMVRALAGGGRLRLNWQCRVGHGVGGEWRVSSWHRVVPEFKVATRRPDVALLGEDGAAIGAVEILHSHRVDRAKAADFAERGLPWVEFRAEDVLAWDGRSTLTLTAADRETLTALARSCEPCRPVVMTPEEIAERAEYAALMRAAVARPRPDLNIAVGHAGKQASDKIVVAATVCARGAAIHTATVALSYISISVARKPHAVLLALRLLASSPRCRPATIWTAGDHEGVCSTSLPSRLWPLRFVTAPDVREEIDALMAKTGSLVVAAAPRSKMRPWADAATNHAETLIVSRPPGILPTNRL